MINHRSNVDAAKTAVGMAHLELLVRMEQLFIETRKLESKTRRDEMRNGQQTKNRFMAKHVHMNMAKRVERASNLYKLAEDELPHSVALFKVLVNGLYSYGP